MFSQKPPKTEYQKRQMESMNVRVNDPDISIPVMYAIRHKPSGHFMPKSLGFNGRGSSFWNHEIGQAKEVRLFRTERAAKLALHAWLLGKHMPEHDDGVYVGWIDTVASRKKEEMEIVTMELVPR